jgi:Holliday junction resolvase RusA-like endonuclease
MFVSRKSGKMFPANNEKYLTWKELATVEIKNSRIKFNGPVAIAAEFFMKDNRGRDLDNMLASVQDALVSAGALAEDNHEFLPMIFAKSGGLDKENPRAEVSFFAVAWDAKSRKWDVDSAIVKWI